MLDPKGEKFNIQYQINKIYISLQKYMSDVSYDEDGENEDILFKETLEYQEKIITDEVDNWAIIDVLTKSKYYYVYI